MIFAIVLFIFFINQQVIFAKENVCDKFRITSPLVNGLSWTAGQCYQVSYDLDGVGDPVNDSIMVDVYNAVTNEKVFNVVDKEEFNLIGVTRAFNMNVPESGSFYYMVTLIHNGVMCEPKKTVEFHVTVNDNSPPNIC